MAAPSRQWRVLRLLRLLRMPQHLSIAKLSDLVCWRRSAQDGQLGSLLSRIGSMMGLAALLGYEHTHGRPTFLAPVAHGLLLPLGFMSSL